MKDPDARLILASASASRQGLLRAAGVAFDSVPAHIDEGRLAAALQARGDRPEAIAEALAAEKAVHVSRQNPGALVLGGDSVLAFDKELIGKCSDLAGLRALLLRLSGRSHRLISAAVLVRDGTLRWRHSAHARLTMRPFGPEFLDWYLEKEGQTVLSCVGGYRYEGLGAQLFEAVEGDYFTVLGLPLLPVLAALRAEGILRS